MRWKFRQILVIIGLFLLLNQTNLDYTLAENEGSNSYPNFTRISRPKIYIENDSNFTCFGQIPNVNAVKDAYIWMVRLNNENEIQNYHFYGDGIHPEWLKCVYPLKDNKYAILSDQMTFDGNAIGYRQIFLRVINYDGSLIWEFKSNNPDNTYYYGDDVYQLSNNSFHIRGSTLHNREYFWQISPEGNLERFSDWYSNSVYGEDYDVSYFNESQQYWEYRGKHYYALDTYGRKANSKLNEFSYNYDSIEQYAITPEYGCVGLYHKGNSAYLEAYSATCEFLWNYTLPGNKMEYSQILAPIESSKIILSGHFNSVMEENPMIQEFNYHSNQLTTYELNSTNYVSNGFTYYNKWIEDYDIYDGNEYFIGQDNGTLMIAKFNSNKSLIFENRIEMDEFNTLFQEFFPDYSPYSPSNNNPSISIPSYPYLILLMLSWMSIGWILHFSIKKSHRII